ncbi:MAG: aminopeptidase N [Gammaproteobacteria bacterium]
MPDLAEDNLTNTPKTIYLKDYTPPDFLVDTVSLEFALDPEKTVVNSTMQLRRNPTTAPSAPLILDGHELELLSIQMDGTPLDDSRYQLTNGQLIIRDMPESTELVIQTTIHPANNTALEGLYVSSGMFCTQCEAEGFRRITFFPDRPDVMARFTTKITADKSTYPILLSNGNPVASADLDNGKHSVTWEDPFPKPAYLFALVAGDLVRKQDSFTTCSGKQVDLHLYVEKANQDKCDHALASLKQSMRWDEDTYGREYDLDIFMIVAVNDFNMGAMENKGLNIFNSSCVLASPATATDGDFYNIQSIIGHEYFHNWSGNRVTCRDWFQLSLKEGFTVFRDQEFSADLNSAAVERISCVNILRSHQFAQDAGPMAHPIRPDSYMEIGNFYTVTVYNKGAEVVRMIRTLLGNEAFRKGSDLYFERHDGQAVTTDDFVAAMQDSSGIDLTQFKRWYSQAGTPVIHVSGERLDGDRYALTLKQSCAATPKQPNKAAFHLPLSVALLDSSGKCLPLALDNDGNTTTEKVLELRETEQTFVFNNISTEPVVSLNRDFSAPVKLVQERDNDTLAFLLAHDNDPFNRWNAGQDLYINVLLEMIEAIRNQQPHPETKSVVSAFSVLLKDEQTDPALIAQILTLPSESYLADQCEEVDVDAIHQARNKLKNILATSLQEQFLHRYTTASDSSPYRFTSVAMANRSLKNSCLAYLMEADTDTAKDLCAAQIEQSDNMTDTLGALSILAQHELPERQKFLDDFYSQWQQDPLVVDKWFGLQAGSQLPDTLETVKKLMQHPAFSITNPNKVRAVIGRFCHGNTINFHRIDGSGYRFLSDQVIKLDALNPQIAARLVGALIRWRRFDPTRQSLMQAELTRIQKTEKLSKDVYEIVTKGLMNE